MYEEERNGSRMKRASKKLRKKKRYLERMKRRGRWKE
jgi:hypothetical protein